MKKFAIIMAVAGLILAATSAAQANGYYVKHDFETPWTGDYAPGWESEGYRHGDEPISKMVQVDLTGTGRTGYGAKVYVDSVPEDWMWWSAIHVTGIPEGYMDTQYDPWVSVYMYDEGYSSGKDSTGQLYTVPSLVTGDDDWTDVQFGGRPWGDPEGSYYYTWADTPHPDWQEVTTVTRPNRDATPPDEPVWVHLKIQLSSADNKMHFYLNGIEVGTSTRDDYLDLGTLILANMFDAPLTDWGENKPYVIFDDFEYGSTAPEPATMLLLLLGGIGVLIRQKRRRL